MTAKSKITASVLVVVLISVTLLISGIVLFQGANTNDHDIESSDAITQSIAVAKNAAKEGDVDEVKRQYTKLIDAEDNPKHKIMLMIDWSAVLYAAGNAKESINVAKMTEKYSEDKFLIADWLSRVYEEEGDYKLATDYYRLAAKLADSPMNDLGLDRRHYESEAKRVEELIK